MRTIEQIVADIEVVESDNDAFKAERKARIEAATKKIDDDLATAKKEIHQRGVALNNELEQVKIANASHPYEGKTVYRVEERRTIGGYRGSRTKTFRYRGIVKIIRSYEDMPERNHNDRFARMPELGDVIIQRIDAKGQPVKSWEKIYEDQGDLPRGWMLEEEGGAA